MIAFLSRLLPVAALLLPLPHALAAEWAGTAKAVSGSVNVERAGQQLPVAVGDRLYPQDKLMTGRDGRLAVTLRDDTRISLSANTQLIVSEFAFNPSTQSGGVVVSVLKGVSAFVSGLVAKSSPSAMKVTTPTATLGIRGTEFVVDLGS